jgi:hypothetical protein
MGSIKAPRIQKAQAKQRREKVRLTLLCVDGLVETKNPKPKLIRKLTERNISTMIVILK